MTKVKAKSKAKAKANAKSRQRNRTKSAPSSFSVRKLVLSIILVVMVIIVISTFYAFFFTKEQKIKSSLSALASDYYENYFYENMVNSEEFKKINNTETALSKYHDKGLTPISLNNLLLSNDQKNYEKYHFLTDYCDEEKTTVIFYPDPPYKRTSYHTEYTYTCNF